MRRLSDGAGQTEKYKALGRTPNYYFHFLSLNAHHKTKVLVREIVNGKYGTQNFVRFC